MKRTFAKLLGKRLAVINEAPGRRLNYEMLKLLSGGDTLSGAPMRQDDREQEPTHKSILPTNERPNVPGDPAWRGRLHFVPFLGDFSGDKGDRFIEQKLWNEREGILHKLIQGCVEAKRDGLRPPQIVREATDDLMEEMDIAGQFLSEQCISTGVDDDFASQAETVRAIQSWLPGVMAGEDRRVDRIIMELKTRFPYKRRRVGNGPAKQRQFLWGFVGLKLSASPEKAA